MKKVLIIIGILLSIVLLAAFLVPIIFKDDIRAAVDSALEQSLKADFVFDTEDFDVSLFKHFPNPSASISNFGVVNRAPFEGEVLFAVREMDAIINLGSLIFGDQMKIKGVILNEPKVFLKVLEEGTANYDIAIEEETPVGGAEQPTANYNIGIEEWKITNGEVVYEDLSIPFKMTLKNLEHTGSGDFTQDIINMQTYSKADSVSVWFENVEYVSDKTAEIDMGLQISENYEKYEFLENNVRINDFSFDFEGWLKMLQNDAMDMDITFSSKDNSFKSLLSVVPGMYHDEFEELQTEGQLTFEGMAKGVYDSLQIPQFQMKLLVDNASLQYPDLEESIRDINIDLQVENPGNAVENTRIALNNFHMNMGGEPIDAKLIVENLKNYPIDASLKGKINLGNLSQVIPVEGMTYRGILDLDFTANGIYDSVRQVMPQMDGQLSYNNGFIKSEEFPAALDNFNVNATIKNPTGEFEDFVTRVSEFNFLMDGEPFTGNATISNLDNITWDLIAKGTVDLEKLSQILALEDMQIKGLLAANINSKGTMAALEAERYEDLPTSGTAILTNFSYSDNEMPYEFSVAQAETNFNPDRLTLSKMNGQIGKSDFAVTGFVSNYIDYALNENAILRGNFNFESDNLDLNEFMSDEETTPDVEEESATGVIQIPENVDVILNANVKKATLLDMEMRDITGSVVANKGVANMNNISFNLLDGKFLLDGSYNALNIEEPKYDFNLNINRLSVNEAAKQFKVVREFVPVAESIRGKFSTEFKLAGLLTREMEPDLSTITGAGLITLVQAALKDSKIIEGVTKITKFKNTDEIDLDDVQINARIENGKLIVDPFDIEMLGYRSVITGSTGIDGSIEYLVDIEVPAAQAAQVLGKFTGANLNKETIILPVVISGTYKNPKFGLKTDALKNEVKEAAKEKAKEELKEEAKDVLKDVVKDEKVKDKIGDIIGGSKKDTPKKADTTRVVDSVEEKVEDAAKDAIKKLFPTKKKKKDNGNN